MANEAPERIWAASVTENYGEWQTTTNGLPRPTEYIRADLAALSSDAVAGGEEVEEFEPYSLVDKAQAWDMLAEKNKVIAALEAQLAERVIVKPLEWDYRQADTAIGTYRINIFTSGVVVLLDGAIIPGGRGFVSESEAKAAAQADYERRILSALED